LVSCETITPTEEGSEPFEVCASYGFTTPSPASENGTTTYIGGWSYEYSIYHPVAKGAVEGKEGFPAEAFIMEVMVTRSDAGDCNVTAFTNETMMCSSCTHCGNETGDDTLYSADCTNLENGRNVECESTDVVYFPFTADAIPNVTITTPNFPTDDANGIGTAPGNGTGTAPTTAPPPTTSDSSPSKINKSMLLLKMISSLIILVAMV
jgi:hypothetical protein